MQIIENWTDIQGKIVSCAVSQQLPGYVVLELAVEKADEVAGVANLLSQAAGQTLVVLVPDELAPLNECRPDVEVVCRVRRAAKNRVFIHPEQFTLKA